MKAKQRIEMFIEIKSKMDEVLDIVRANGAEKEFLATYCFGFSMDYTEDKDLSYEFLAGFNAESELEIDAMIDAVQRCYIENSTDDDDEDDSGSVDYWLNLN